MLKKIFDLRKEELVKGSLILFIMMNIFNFLNYFFHFAMVRLLTAADYGVLAVLMALVNIFDIPAEGIQTVVSRYTSKFNVKREYGKIKYLLFTGIKKIFIVAILVFLIYIPFSFIFGYFTKIEPGLVIFTGIMIFSIFLFPIVRGVIQGRKKFKSLGGSMIIEGVFKLAVSLTLVFLGLRVYGAISGVVSGALFTLLVSFIFIKEILRAKTVKMKIEGILSYSFPVFMVTLTIILIASLDIVFAKIFFTPDVAGKYAVAALLGKIIFFGTFAIGKAMFPLTSEGHEKGEKTKNIFKKAFLIVVGLCIAALLVYGIFPELIISILFGSKYIEIAGIIVFVGLAFSFISLSNLSLIYSLSLRKKKMYFFVLFIFVEIFFFSIMHGNLKEYAIGFATANFIMFIISLIFAIKD